MTVRTNTGSTRTMDLYMAEVTRYPLLSAEEETLIPDRNTPSMEDIYAEHHLQQSVRDILASRLSVREQKVLRMQFGADRRASKTLRQTADELQVSRERVRQINARALRRLRYNETRLKLRRV